MDQSKDEVVKPSYYNNLKISPWDVIDAWGLDYWLGDCIAYICRAGKKPGNDVLDDLKKAREYLSAKIERIERQRGVKSNGPGV